MGVDSLYTNIDTKEGNEAVRNMLNKHPDIRRRDEELLQLLEINLTKSSIEFILEIKGTVMGKKFEDFLDSMNTHGPSINYKLHNN